MLSKILQEVIDETRDNPQVNWIDPEWPIAVNQDPEFSRYMNNVPIDLGTGEEPKRCHGYFALLHNLVSRLPANTTIFELGNREGLSTLAILDALKPTHVFVTYDVVEDLRFINTEKALKLENIFWPTIEDVLGENAQRFSEWICDRYGKISLLFCDTLHTYEQLVAETKAMEKFLCDDAIILVDDIQDDTRHPNKKFHRTKYRFFEEWEGEKYDLTDFCHYPSGFAAFVYRRG
jgi:predicted O-methyltransferase YrrM